MTVAIGIIAHTARQQMAEQLADTLQADYIHVDDGTLGCEANHLHVQQHLLRNYGDTDWHLILEDDAIPCNNFRDQLTAALTVAPTPIVSLYLGYSHPEWNMLHPGNQAIANAGNANWLTHTQLLHAVAYAIHTDLLPVTLNTDGYDIDTAITNWAIGQGHQVAYTLPSLVDHADTTPVITQRHDNRPRVYPRKAWQWGTRDHWTNQTAPL